MPCNCLDKSVTHYSCIHCQLYEVKNTCHESADECPIPKRFCLDCYEFCYGSNISTHKCFVGKYPDTPTVKDRLIEKAKTDKIKKEFEVSWLGREKKYEQNKHKIKKTSLEPRKNCTRCDFCNLYYTNMYGVDTAYTCACWAFFCDEKKSWFVWGSYGSEVGDCSLFRLNKDHFPNEQPPDLHRICDLCLLTMGKEGDASLMFSTDTGCVNGFTDEDYDLVFRYIRTLRQLKR